MLGAGVARINRLAPGKAFVLAMPEANAVLSQPPAQEHFFVIDQRGKIEQAYVQILHHAASRLNALERGFDAIGQVVALIPQLGGLLIGDLHAAQERDAIGHLQEVPVELGHLPAGVYGLKQDGLDLLPGALRLGQREEFRLVFFVTHRFSGAFYPCAAAASNDGAQFRRLLRAHTSWEPTRRASNACDRKAREGRSIEAVIQSEEPESILQGVSADQRVGKNAARTRVSRFSPVGSVGLKGPTSSPPDGFVQIPVNRDAGVFEEGIQERLASTGECHELGENWCGNDEASAPECAIEGGLCQRIEGVVSVPQSHNDIRVDCGGHWPRNSRTRRRMAFLPDGVLGFPIPRYRAKGLLDLTGRTRTPLPSFSKSNLSPGRTPSARRISFGTVTCPLLVIRACFFTRSPPSPYFSTRLLTFRYPAEARTVLRQGAGRRPFDENDPTQQLSLLLRPARLRTREGPDSITCGPRRCLGEYPLEKRPRRHGARTAEAAPRQSPCRPGPEQLVAASGHPRPGFSGAPMLLFLSATILALAFSLPDRKEALRPQHPRASPAKSFALARSSASPQVSVRPCSGESPKGRAAISRRSRVARC